MIRCSLPIYPDMFSQARDVVLDPKGAKWYWCKD